MRARAARRSASASSSLGSRGDRRRRDDENEFAARFRFRALANECCEQAAPDLLVQFGELAAYGRFAVTEYRCEIGERVGNA